MDSRTNVIISSQALDKHTQLVSGAESHLGDGGGYGVAMDGEQLRENLYLQGYGDITVKEYAETLLRLSRAGLGLDYCTPHDVRVVVNHIVPRTWSSRKMVRQALRAYWTITGRIDTDPVVLKLLAAVNVPRQPRFQCRARSEDEARRLAHHAQTWDRGAEGLAAMFGLYGALRRAEIAGLKWDQFDDGWLTLTGKGEVTDTIAVHPRVLERLEWWRGFEPTDVYSSLRTRPGSRYLFPGRRTGHVTPATVWAWVKKVAVEAHIPDLTPHELRHTCLAEINDRTHDLRATQEFARHENPSTTVLYTRVKKSRMRAVVDGITYEPPPGD